MAHSRTRAADIGDLVDEFLSSPSVAIMRQYSQMLGSPNPVTDQADALHRGDSAVVDGEHLPADVLRELGDPYSMTTPRVRLQRGIPPEVISHV